MGEQETTPCGIETRQDSKPGGKTRGWGEACVAPTFLMATPQDAPGQKIAVETVTDTTTPEGTE